MASIDEDLERLSRRGTPADPDEVIARAMATASSEPPVREHASRTLVSLAAACVVAVGLGAFAFMVANRQNAENISTDAPAPTSPPTVASESTSVPVAAPVSTIPVPASLSAEGLAELATLDDDHLVVASSLPSGWTAGPILVDNGSQRWEFSDAAGSPLGQVLAYAGSDGFDSGQPSATEVRWTLETSNASSTIATARAGDIAQVTVFISGIDLDTVEEFLDGLRIGDPDDHPAGAFNTSTDGTVVAAVDEDLAVRAGSVGDYLCWAMTSNSSSSNGCVQDPLGPGNDNGPDTSDGIAVLNIGGTGIPKNFIDADAPIVTTIVHLTGVTSLDVASVSVNLSTGETVDVPVGDLDESLGLRFFAFRTTVDGDAFSGDGLIESVTESDPSTDQATRPADTSPTDDPPRVVPDGFVPAPEGPDNPRDPIQRFLGVPADIEESSEWVDRVQGRAVVECMAAQGFDLDESTWRTRTFDPSADDHQQLVEALESDGGCEELANRQTNLLPDAEAEFAILDTSIRADPQAIEVQAALQECLDRNNAADALAIPDECADVAAQSNEALQELFEEYAPSWMVEHRDILETLRDRLAGLDERSGTPI